MAWTPDITITNVRDECRLITVTLKIDALVQAGIDSGKAYVESVLRSHGYDTTNPAADLSVRDAGLYYVVARLLNSIYGSEQWNEEVAGAARGYWGQVRMFIDSEGRLIRTPNLPLAPRLMPSVNNVPVQDGLTTTQFDTDSAQAQAFDVKVPDEDYV